MTDKQWDALMIPVNVAFFFFSSATNGVAAIYPSPAGPVESTLDLDCWDEIAAANPPVTGIEPDVEALLANRAGVEPEYFIVPIDECYKLVGLIRANWRGLSGGAGLWQVVAQFFEGLSERAAFPPKEPRA